MVDESHGIAGVFGAPDDLIRGIAPDRLAELASALVRAGPLQLSPVVLPDTGDTLSIARPHDFDVLLDAAVDDPEQNLPYWAELWPSGIALATGILRRPELVRDARVLELGCGLGVTAIAALRSGADLLVTDYAEESLALCAINCLRATGVEPAAEQLNWRAVSSAHVLNEHGPFPVVLAADVLYEERDIAPLLDLAERLVMPGGLLWLAEPGRRPASAFLEEIGERGWSRSRESCHGPWPDPEDNQKGVVVGLHRLIRPHS